MDNENRRPIKTRSCAWANQLAGLLAKFGCTPNGISIAGIVAAICGAIALATSSHTTSITASTGLLLLAAFSIQLRLLCNMLDGLVAIEKGLKTKLGDLFNEIPDRLEDVLLLLGAGYGSGMSAGVTLGWIAAMLALSTAYIRQVGGALGLAFDFCGPFAKPQRMFWLTVTLISSAIENNYLGSRYSVLYGLTLIVIGTAFTVVKRLKNLVGTINSR